MCSGACGGPTIRRADWLSSQVARSIGRPGPPTPLPPSPAMPTYEYRCADCSHEFECFQRMSDEPVSICPECGGSVERLISAGAGLLFKGEGFYITDYRSESYKKKAEKESTGPTTEPSGGGSKGGSASDSASGSAKESGSAKSSGGED